MPRIQLTSSFNDELSHTLDHELLDHPVEDTSREPLPTGQCTVAHRQEVGHRPRAGIIEQTELNPASILAPDIDVEERLHVHIDVSDSLELE